MSYHAWPPALNALRVMRRQRRPIMIMRITWGKLRAGTWQEYEQAYHEMVAGKAVPGLRGRWLAHDVNEQLLESLSRKEVAPIRGYS